MSNFNRAALNRAIDKFLEARRESVGGGWAKIVDGDIALLGMVIRMLREMKCEADADGDYPIEVAITNRRTHQRSHFMAVPYDFDRTGAVQVDNFDRYFEATLSNLSIATTAFQFAMTLRHERKRKEEKTT